MRILRIYKRHQFLTLDAESCDKDLSGDSLFTCVVNYCRCLLCLVADIPGIIENAHLNRGLGFSFLRHVERCPSLMFVVDLSMSDPCQQLRVLRHELDMYEAGLSQRPHVVIGNKTDLPGTEESADKLRAFVGDSALVLTISAKRQTNIDTLSRIIREMYERYMEKTTDAK